jgi:TetR/AcrR family transcriptional regulator
MHGFVLGADPEIGKVARRGFLEVYRFLKNEVEMTPDAAADFLAHGMLLNTLAGIQMTDEYADDDAKELLECSLGPKLPLLLEVARGARKPTSAVS